MKFEVGKEYVGDNGLRMRVVVANEWGAAFEHLSDGYVGQYGHSSHRGHCWRPAPRVVERWIVLAKNGQSDAYAKESDAMLHVGHYSAGMAVVAGPFKIEVPW